jgi:hypothetical protein
LIIVLSCPVDTYAYEESVVHESLVVRLGVLHFLEPVNAMPTKIPKDPT